MIFVFTIIRVAFKALGRNTMRSILTMLGIIIGVGAVIAMVSVGEGAQEKVSSSISSMGSNLLYVTPGSFNSGGVRSGLGTMTTLTVEDYQAILRECSAVKYASPGVTAGVMMIYGNQNWMSSVQGGNTNILEIRNYQVEYGSMWTQEEQDASARVCIIGKTIVDYLFPQQDPIGQQIRIRNAPWTVIGVLKSRGQSGVGQDQDDTVFAPYTTVMKKLQRFQFINNIMVSAKSEELVLTAKAQIEELMRYRHNIANKDDDDFQVRNLSDMAELAKQSNETMTLLLASIAGVSLVVGAIGVMNIMLVSVTERTREIGIRMAVGATGGDIQFQFLTEAFVLALFGGIVGILVGIAASKILADSLGWATFVSSTAVALAFTVSAAIGIGAGWYPARKASRLDPIEALRFE
ncbi:MAG: export transporter permease protein [Acidobacteria bacterium]|nr:export transporter permease protein [Acidobacteriota bacterium]